MGGCDPFPNSAAVPRSLSPEVRGYGTGGGVRLRGVNGDFSGRWDRRGSGSVSFSWEWPVVSREGHARLAPADTGRCLNLRPASPADAAERGAAGKQGAGSWPRLSARRSSDANGSVMTQLENTRAGVGALGCPEQALGRWLQSQDLKPPRRWFSDEN